MKNWFWETEKAKKKKKPPELSYKSFLMTSISKPSGVIWGRVLDQVSSELILRS